MIFSRHIYCRPKDKVQTRKCVPMRTATKPKYTEILNTTYKYTETQKTCLISKCLPHETDHLIGQLTTHSQSRCPSLQPVDTNVTFTL